MLAEIKRIKQEVGAKYDVTEKEIDGPDRTARVVRARHEAMARCKKETPCSYPEIGYYFGRRDHATVIYACRRYKKHPDMFSKE